jgi:hypothetical protein
MLADSKIYWRFANGLLKVRGDDREIQKLNNRVTMNNGLLVWMRDEVMFEKLKK